MQHIQDKEFDKLFKEKLLDAEMQPSPGLWDNIARGLEPKQKRTLPVYWLAAAMVLLVVSIGLLRPETERIRLQAPATSVTEPIKTKQIAGRVEKEAAFTEDKSTPLIIAPRLKVTNVKNDVAVMQPKQVTARPDNKVKAIAEPPLEEIPKKEIVPEENKMIAKVDVTAESDIDRIDETEQPEHKGIRNVGDLVNFVVNKVDKREKKLLQFNTDDDDNSSLVAINIGILRINKRTDK